MTGTGEGKTDRAGDDERSDHLWLHLSENVKNQRLKSKVGIGSVLGALGDGSKKFPYDSRGMESQTGPTTGLQLRLTADRATAVGR